MHSEFLVPKSPDDHRLQVDNNLNKLAKVTGAVEAVPTAEQLQGQTCDDHVYKASRC
jgi:hypothetical protein